MGNILVLGDIFCDEFWNCTSNRANPESDSPLLNLYSTEIRAGGAANVAVNIKELGGNVTLLGRLGDDLEALKILAVLNSHQVSHNIKRYKDYKSIVKLRVLLESRYQIRIDKEESIPLSNEQEKDILDFLNSNYKNYSVLVLSDYDKGQLSESLYPKIISWAQENQIFVISDPKGNNPTKYTGTNLLTPNIKECIDMTGTGDLDEAARILLQYSEHVLITMSENGMRLYSKGWTHHFDALGKHITTVVGAGDILNSGIAVGLSEGKNLLDSLDFANRVVAIGLSKSMTPVVKRKEVI